MNTRAAWSSKKNGDQRELTTDVIFVELGLKPNSDFLANLIELEPDGRIKIDNNNRTSLPGIFAAGDVTNVYAEQVLIAIGEGAKAGLAAYEYLLGQPVGRAHHHRQRVALNQSPNQRACEKANQQTTDSLFGGSA